MVYELNLEEMGMIAGGVPDDMRKEFLLAMIRLDKAFGSSREHCLEWYRARVNDEEYAFIEANW